MKKLSRETSELIDKLTALYADVEERILEESGGTYGLCSGLDLKLQLHASMCHKHDLAELESFVGPFRLNHVYEDGTKSYHFMLGDITLGCIIMPADTIDSRATGGEANDVRFNKKA